VTEYSEINLPTAGCSEQLAVMIETVNNLWNRVARSSTRAKESIPPEVAEALAGWKSELVFFLDRADFPPASAAAGGLLHQLEHAIYFVDKIDSGGPRGNSSTGERISPWKHPRRTS
jgi:hypothetical protein